jgi:hypothetical protein
VSNAHGVTSSSIFEDRPRQMPNKNNGPIGIPMVPKPKKIKASKIKYDGMIGGNSPNQQFKQSKNLKNRVMFQR